MKKTLPECDHADAKSRPVQMGRLGRQVVVFVRRSCDECERTAA